MTSDAGLPPGPGPSLRPLGARALQVAFWASLLPGLPAALLSLLLLIDMVNPLRAAFITTIRVRNDSGERVLVTPVGRFKESRAVVPQYLLVYPAVPSAQQRDFPVEAGETLTVHFDWDDINLAELVLRRADGTARTLPVDETAGAACCHRPPREEFVIDGLDALALPDADALGAPTAFGGYTVQLQVMLLLASLPVSLWAIRRRRTRRGGRPGAPSAPAA